MRHPFSRSTSPTLCLFLPASPGTWRSRPPSFLHLLRVSGVAIFRVLGRARVRDTPGCSIAELIGDRRRWVEEGRELTPMWSERGKCSMFFPFSSSTSLYENPAAHRLVLALFALALPPSYFLISIISCSIIAPYCFFFSLLRFLVALLGNTNLVFLLRFLHTRFRSAWDFQEASTF